MPHAAEYQTAQIIGANRGDVSGARACSQKYVDGGAVKLKIKVCINSTKFKYKNVQLLRYHREPFVKV
jgi:hypothetical protein